MQYKVPITIVYSKIILVYGTNNSHAYNLSNILKEQCQELFDPKKTLPGPHMDRLRRFCEIFCFHATVREKHSEEISFSF